MDPRILKVEEIRTVKNTFAIVYPNNTVLIQDGIIASPDKLSSGTKDGVGLAQLITGMKLNAHEFYYSGLDVDMLWQRLVKLMQQTRQAVNPIF